MAEPTTTLTTPKNPDTCVWTVLNVQSKNKMNGCQSFIIFGTQECESKHTQTSLLSQQNEVCTP